MSEVVLVTGASGFLGFHLVKLLISHDDATGEIRCLDIADPEEAKRKILERELIEFNVKLKRNDKRIIWIKGDIRDVNLVEESLKNVKCIIHCAAKIDIWTAQEDQDAAELESVNVEGTENLLKAAIRLGVPKFVHVSSFEAYLGYDTIYYSKESTIPENKSFIFGESGRTKKEAENKILKYSNNKLQLQVFAGKDSLNAIIVRLPAIYGEFDRLYVSKILELTKYFGGKLRRLSNVWIGQQPIYVGNAAWSLIKAKQRMEEDATISGEYFNVTDDTPIGDSFDFFKPYLESKGMQVTEGSYPFFPTVVLLMMYFAVGRLVKSLDFLGLFTKKNNRLRESIEKDISRSSPDVPRDSDKTPLRKHWYDYIMPQILWFACLTNFLNRTKAALRLDYEVLIEPEEAKMRSIEWYKDNVLL